jgi:predicted nuclease of predicted toxin-antitoxin system
LRLLLDEQLSPAIAEQLRSCRHDAVCVADAGLSGLPDDRVLSWASGEHRAVVTNNIRDFRLLHGEYLRASQSHYGIVLVPTGKFGLRRDRLGSLIAALDELLTRFTDEDALRDTEYFL